MFFFHRPLLHEHVRADRRYHEGGNAAAAGRVAVRGTARKRPRVTTPRPGACLLYSCIWAFKRVGLGTRYAEGLPGMLVAGGKRRGVAHWRVDNRRLLDVDEEKMRVEGPRGGLTGDHRREDVVIECGCGGPVISRIPDARTGFAAEGPYRHLAGVRTRKEEQIVSVLEDVCSVTRNDPDAALRLVECQAQGRKTVGQKNVALR